MAGRRKRLIPDMELWDRVIETVTPISKPTKKIAEQAKDTTLVVPIAEQAISPPERRKNIPKHAVPIPVLKTPVKRLTPPLSGIDRRTGQKLLRGQISIEARIDLHGETLETARVKLFSYLSASYERGQRFVIVITGKGSGPISRHMLHGLNSYDTPERGGRLRRAVPEWLNESHFRNIVSGYQPAHPKHGGGGALYVRLRRNPSLAA